MNKPINKKSVVIAAAVAVAFGLGAGAGAAGGSTSEDVPAPAPTVTVTPKPEVRTETKEVTPPSCLLALDYADEGFQLSGKGFAAVSEIFSGLQAGDLSGLTAQTDVMQEVSRETKALMPKYNAAKTECRSK